MTYQIPRTTTGKVQQFAFPGGYEIAYLDNDCSVLCAECVQAEEDLHGHNQHPFLPIESHFLVYEDCHCGECSRLIPGAYSEES